MRNHGFRGLVAAAAFATSLGMAAPALASFEGFGKDIPLDSAARQIVPEGWTVEFADGVDRKAPISWSSAGDWQGALRSALLRKGYSAEVGEGKVTIVKAAPSPAPKAAAPRPYASSPAEGAAQKRGPEKRRTVRQTVQEEPYEGGGGFSIRPYKGGSSSTEQKMVGKGDFEDYRAPAAGATFSVSEGQMLHPVLADWAAAAGWGLVWNSQYDYRIEAQATFGGDFIEAVSKLAEAMSEARPAITVDFYKGNRVVVISNKSSDEAN